MGVLGPGGAAVAFSLCSRTRKVETRLVSQRQIRLAAIPKGNFFLIKINVYVFFFIFFMPITCEQLFNRHQWLRRCTLI